MNIGINYYAEGANTHGVNENILDVMDTRYIVLNNNDEPIACNVAQSKLEHCKQDRGRQSLRVSPSLKVHVLRMADKAHHRSLA